MKLWQLPAAATSLIQQPVSSSFHRKIWQKRCICQSVTTTVLSQGKYSHTWLSYFSGRTVHREPGQALVFLDLLQDLKRHEHLISGKVKVISHNASADRYCYSYWNDRFLSAQPSQSSSLDVLTNKIFYPPLLDAGLEPNFSLFLSLEGLKSDHIHISEVTLGLLCHT